MEHDREKRILHKLQVEIILIFLRQSYGIHKYPKNGLRIFYAVAECLADSLQIGKQGVTTLNRGGYFFLSQYHVLNEGVHGENTLTILNQSFFYQMKNCICVLCSELWICVGACQPQPFFKISQGDTVRREECQICQDILFFLG